MNLFVRIFAWVFALLCIVSAILQYNDPDPIFWILIYVFVALVAIGVACNKLTYGVIVIVAILLFVGSICFLPETFEGFEIGKGDIKNIEEARESGGLLIMSLTMFFFAWSKNKN